MFTWAVKSGWQGRGFLSVLPGNMDCLGLDPVKSGRNLWRLKTPDRVPLLLVLLLSCSVTHAGTHTQACSLSVAMWPNAFIKLQDDFSFLSSEKFFLNFSLRAVIKVNVESVSCSSHSACCCSPLRTQAAVRAPRPGPRALCERKEERTPPPHFTPSWRLPLVYFLYTTFQIPNVPFLEL